MNSLLDILVVLLICCFVLWVVSIVPFIEGWMKQLIQGAVALFLIVWLLYRLLPMAGSL